MSDDAQGWKTDSLSPDEQQRFTALYGSHPQGAAPTTPGFFTGWYKAAAGIPSGLANVGLDVARLAVNPPDALGQQYRFENPGLGDTSDPINTGADLFDAAANSKRVLDNGWNALQPRLNASLDRLQQDAADTYRPDQQTTGFVGNTLFGAADVVTRIGVPGLLGAPELGLPLAAGTTGYERAKDLEAQGVDPETAGESGALAAGSLLAMGGVAGSLGKSVLMRSLTSAGTNIAFGAGNRALDSAILRSNGYEAQAAQQQWNDAHAILADGLIGAAFGLLPHAQEEKAAAAAPEAQGEAPTGALAPAPAAAPEAPSAPPARPYVPADLVDSALTIKNAQNANDVAPGVPADPRSAQAHLDALDTATDQLLDGQDVDVEPLVRDATFVPRPDDAEAMNGIAVALRASLPEEEPDPFPYAVRDENGQITGYANGENTISAFPDLTPAQREVEADAAAQVLDDPEAAIAAYNALDGKDSTTDGGNVINTDHAREIFPAYNTGPEARSVNALAVHEPASWVAKQAFERALARPVREGKDDSVLFTGGGTGAGKSSGMARIPRLKQASERTDITYDGNLKDFGSASKKIDAALASGRKVNIVYTFRDPAQAFVHGVLPRAERADYGRTVPIPSHVDTHVGAAETYLRLKAHYADNPDVTIHALWNDYEPGVRSEVQANLPDEVVAERAGADRATLASEVRNALEHERQAGRVSDRVYRGTLGVSAGETDGGRNTRGQGSGGVALADGRGNASGRTRPGHGETAEDLNPAAGGVSVSGDSIRSSDAAYGTPARHPWVELDDTRNIPMAGGTSADGRTVYISRYMPDTVEAGGKTIDAKEGVFVHEVEEQKVMLPDGPKSPEYMAALRADIASEAKANPKSPTIPESDLEKVAKGEPLEYPAAHAIATVRENAFIRKKYGIDPELYQKALADGIEEARAKARAEGDIPADLDTTPYDDMGQRRELQGQGETPEAGGATVGAPSEGQPRVDDASPTGSADSPRAGAGEAQQGAADADAQGDGGDGLDPHRAGELARARQAVADRPDTALDDGVSAAAALQAADADVAEAGRQADAVKAAIQCFLSFGSEL